MSVPTKEQADELRADIEGFKKLMNEALDDTTECIIADTYNEQVHGRMIILARTFNGIVDSFSLKKAGMLG